MELFRGKVVVITGGASGIGKALGEKLARFGADVVLSDVNQASLEKVVEGIKARGGKAWGEVLDVSDYDAFKDHLEGIVASKGRIDYLFNNAGVVITHEFRDMELDHWKKVIDVNLNGVFYGASIAYKQMVKQGSGHIINVSSIEGMMPFPLTGSYVATKYAVLGLSQSMWVEGRSLGVKVSAVCPGFIKTNFVNSANISAVGIDPEKLLDQYKNLEKTGITPDKCADVILKGVAKNKPIIPVSSMAHLIWRLARLAPIPLMKFVSKDFDRWRNKVRKAA